jgi:hypothetical protein
MSEVAYSFRRSGLSRERTYRLGPDALEWSGAGQDGRIAYAEIEALRFQKYRVRGTLAATVKRLWSCVVSCRTGPRVILLPTHYVRSGVLEDRSAAFYPFVGQLMARVRSANPDVRFGNQDDWRASSATPAGAWAGRCSLACCSWGGSYRSDMPPTRGHG